MRIIIVEDSDTMRALLRRHLANAGYEGTKVVDFDNVPDALKCIRGYPPPDLVLADLYMPGLTGMDLLVQLREEGNRVKFGFITQESDENLKASAIAAGAEFVLTKPITSLAIRAAVDEALGRGR